MSQMPLISVIVPVYKVEAYLDKCISSIVNQTYRNLEIILVDDGSPDRSGEICDAWAAKDRRIQVIHQENAGGGAARNAALDIANGALIAFVDSDDYISNDMYSHLYTFIEQGADIAECSYIDVLDSNESFRYSHSALRSYAAQEAMAEHIQDRIFRQLIWNKLYRREMIGSIRFPIGKKIDDEFFTYQVLGNAKTLIWSEKICYAYRQQESSVMHTMGSQKRLQAVEAKVERHRFIREKFPELTDISLKVLCFTCMYLGQISLQKEDKSTSKKTLEYLKRVLREYPLITGGRSVKEMIWPTLARLSFTGTCRLRNLLKIGF